MSFDIRNYEVLKGTAAVAMVFVVIVGGVVAGNVAYYEFFFPGEELLTDGNVSFAASQREHLDLSGNMVALSELFLRQNYLSQCSFDLDSVQEIEIPLNDSGAVQKAVVFQNVVCPPLPEGAS